MTTLYEFSVGYTKLGIGAAPSVAPTITVVDSANNVLVTGGTAVTALSNLVGAYRYSYSGANDLIVYAQFHTTDTTIDQQDLFAVANVGPVVRDIQTRLPAALTANGNMKSSLLEIISTALSEGATGRIAAAWQAAWNIASSAWTSAAINQSGDAYARLGAPTGASVSVDIATLIRGLVPIFGVTVNDPSPTASQFITTLTSSVNDFYKGLYLVFTNNTLSHQVRQIKSYTGSTKQVILSAPFTSAPVNGDVFCVLTTMDPKSVDLLANALGTDNRILLSVDAQTAKLDLVDSPNATAITAIQLGLSKPGTAQTITPPADMALNSTVAKDATVMKTASYTAPDNADIGTIKADVENVTYGLSAIKTVVDAINTDVGGSGSQQQVFSVTVGGNPVDGAHVWITTDIEGSNIVASGHTDALGVVTFLLDVGDYYWWKQHAGYNFTNPEAFSVSAP